jgi:predicted site-specific integrase-resolvase
MSGRAVEAVFCFDRHAATDLSVAYAILVPARRARIGRSGQEEGCRMTSAAIYARVSSARQKKDQTIGSQTAALREHAANNRLEVLEEWVFEDEGHSGATMVPPGLEALRDLAAQGCLDVVLVYSPDRLARKFAYQA